MKIIGKLNHLPKYVYRNIISPKVLGWKYRTVLNQNLILKNARRGERCFIMGNGPSIANIDLAALKDEHTFVVNDFNKHPAYTILNKNHHVLSDAAAFSQDLGSIFARELKNKSDNANPKTIFFLNILGKDDVVKRNLFRHNKIFYFGTGGIFSENFSFNIDLDKFLPQPKNTILLCLMIAVYMGFTEIYLLGCEHNFLSYNIGMGGNKSLTYPHFYKNTELLAGLEKIYSSDMETQEKNSLFKNAQLNYEENIAHIYQLFKNYRLFYQKVRKLYPEVKIYNATPNSFLDVFPFVKFEDIKLGS